MKLIVTKFDFEITEDSDILIARNPRFGEESTIDTIRMLDYMLSQGHKFLYHDRGFYYFRNKNKVLDFCCYKTLEKVDEIDGAAIVVCPICGRVFDYTEFNETKKRMIR